MELSKSRDTMPRPPMVRMRSSIHESVQTEATFVPSCIDLKHTYESEAAEQFAQLRQLRAVIQGCLEEVAGSVYDMVGFKDIMFKMEEEFPTSLPVTDMLLLTSKLNRKTTELSRLISCFFGVVFADSHADEHFHFTEIRLVQRELLDVKRKLKASENEKLQLQETLNNVGQVALDHGKAVELLEQHNQALQLQTSALEDQMALLFHQVNSDLETHCKEAYEKVTLDMETQERMNPTRTTYRQTIDSLSQQIRTARTIITDLREALLSCSQGNRTGEAYLAIEPSVKYKLKLLDSNFQQLAGRFTSVKDTVTETAHELMMALHERKRILYLSFQHIRLYDLQVAKLRSAKAIMTQILNYTGDLLQRVQSTFPGGAITSVDRIGRITTQRWHGGYTLAALQRIKSGSGNSGHAVPDLDEAQIMAAESELAALEKDVLTDDRPRSMDATKIPQPVTFITTPSRRNNSSSADSTSRKRLSSVPAIPPNGKLPPSSRKTMPLIIGAERIDGTVTNNAVPFATIYELFDLMRDISADIEKLNGSLTLEDEMAVFLKTLTLSVASTARANAPQTGLERYEGGFEDALMPTGGLTSYGTNLTGDTVNDSQHREEMPPSVIGQSIPTKPETSVDMRLSRAEQAQSDARLARQAQQLIRHQEQITKLQDDFSCRLGFLRQVYESRITDLEMKKCTTKQYESPDHRRRRNAPNKQEDDLQLVRDVNAVRGQDDDLMKMGVKTDREELLAARVEWRRRKLGVQSTRKLREATTKEIEKIERKIKEKRSASAKKKRTGSPSRTS